MISGKIGVMISDKISAMLMIFILLCAFFTVTALATSPPMMLQGNLLIDGEPAAVGTEITAVVDGNEVGATTVTKEGVFGDQRSNRLPVPSNYDVVSIYVNNVKTQTLDLRDYKNGDIVSLNINAGTQVYGMNDAGYSNVAPEEEIPGSYISDTTEERTDHVFQTTPEDVDHQTEYGEDMPMSSPGTNSMILISALILAGIIVVLYLHRSKKK